jgi:hypothetical protein
MMKKSKKSAKREKERRLLDPKQTIPKPNLGYLGIPPNQGK